MSRVGKYQLAIFARYAPHNYAYLAPVEMLEDDGEITSSRGSGLPTNLCCEACGYGGDDLAVENANKRIYFLQTGNAMEITLRDLRLCVSDVVSLP